ncbi:STAS-like domain-containing protein [Peribacillus frigoritolerans]|uniref:STAS-like domain-containing protein n=1 Tax=Peribacillus frigoritolerans TaxID=450367 RepID=UPI001F4F5CB8|nr:DUF4325 domain-containing protein [Peribacillus frigoritolerans]MCK2020669.1 STAS-like domain-containing protein [Peribacillus frigoritolerans]
MVIINVLDYVNMLLQPRWRNNITISFKNVDGVTSSFINTALIELLDDYDFSVIKKHLNFINSSKQINDIIKSRFSFEVNRRKNLVAS